MDVEAFHQAAKERYWQAKDLRAARRLLGDGIKLAQDQEGPDLEKPLQYDLASFCWPGWDEPGIEIAEEDLEAGERAAWANLSLAGRLAKGHGPMANAWFMVGAYDLARGRSENALRAFDFFFSHAVGSGDQPSQFLAYGYRGLAKGARGRSEFDEAIGRLANIEGGASLIDQLQTAERVFGR